MEAYLLLELGLQVFGRPRNISMYCLGLMLIVFLQVLVGMGINKITILKFKSIKVYAFGFCKFLEYLVQIS